MPRGAFGKNKNAMEDSLRDQNLHILQLLLCKSIMGCMLWSHLVLVLLGCLIFLLNVLLGDAPFD